MSKIEEFIKKGKLKKANMSTDMVLKELEKVRAIESFDRGQDYNNYIAMSPFKF